MENKTTDGTQTSLKNSKAKKDKSTMAQKVGDKVEEFGTKLSDKGATKVGKIIHDVGDKIEHIQDQNKS